LQLTLHWKSYELAFFKLPTRALDCQANQRIRATTTRTTARGSVMTSWLLVMSLYFGGSASVTTVPNLSSAAECFRIAESINQFAPRRMQFKCVEVYNAKETK
jgi:hypothetical protein